jgi:Ca-activated chloride channel family protein
MHIQSDRAFVPAGSASTRYLSVTLSAPASAPPPPPGSFGAASPDAAGVGQQGRPGVDVSLVLDRSGSMAGRKIDLARQAVAYAIRLLNGNDQLNVVAYDHEVTVVQERMPATLAARKQALSALGRIDARGSTNLAEGWFTGARALGAALPHVGEPGPGDLPLVFDAAPVGGHAPGLEAGGPDRVRRVLLLTDGLANQGLVDPAALREAAIRLRGQGINTSTFGLGADFDEELLSGLATAGGGHFYFIEHPQQIADFLASELGEVLDVVARDVVFEVTAGAGVRVAVLNPLPLEQDGPMTRVRLGDFVADQEVTLLLAVHIDAQAAGATAAVQCRVRDREAVMFAQPMQVDWTAVSVEQDRQQPVNREVVLEVARMIAEAARVRALAANRHGGYGEAKEALRGAAQQIEQLAVDDDAVKAVVEVLLAEEVHFMARMAPAEMKARHFASYAISHSREPGGVAKKRRKS